MSKALIIIDMQRAFFEQEPLLGQRVRLVEACNGLIRSAREHDMPVITLRTMHSHLRDTWTLNMLDDDRGFLFADDEDSSYLEGLDISGAHEIIKTRDSGFWGTKLEQYLREHDIDMVVLAGVSTHLCIYQTAQDAYNLNLRVELAADAIASERPELHDTFMDLLQQHYRMTTLHGAEL